MFTNHDIARDTDQLYGRQAKKGYDWWWHSFTARHATTGEEKSFYIEFFLCNPQDGGAFPVFGQLPENKARHIHPSYLMVNVGTWGIDGVQLHRFFGWDAVKVGTEAPYQVDAADCHASETELRGSVSVTEEEVRTHPEWMSDAGSMSWNLQVEKVIPFNVGYGAGDIMRHLQLFEMFWHAEGMKTRYQGEVWFNGQRYIVEKDHCYGYADKNWGSDFTTPWLWLSSCDLSRNGKPLENSVFDIGGGRPKIGPVALKGKLLGALYLEGEGYEFNFSKFWTFTRTKFHVHETDTQVIWHVEQENLTHKLVTDITCEKEEMLLIRYEAPDGSMRHNRLWNGGTGKGSLRLYHYDELLDTLECAHAGCEYGEYDATGPYR